MRYQEPKAPLHFTDEQAELYYETLRVKTTLKSRGEEEMAERLEQVLENMREC